MLSLQAGSGIVIQDSMATTSTGKLLVMDADFESYGDGSFTVVNGKTVSSNNGDTTVTCWDIDMSGSLSTGTAFLSVHASKVDQTMALGSASKHL